MVVKQSKARIKKRKDCSPVEGGERKGGWLSRRDTHIADPHPPSPPIHTTPTHKRNNTRTVTPTIPPHDTTKESPHEKGGGKRHPHTHTTRGGQNVEVARARTGTPAPPPPPRPQRHGSRVMGLGGAAAQETQTAPPPQSLLPQPPLLLLPPPAAAAMKSAAAAGVAAVPMAAARPHPSTRTALPGWPRRGAAAWRHCRRRRCRRRRHERQRSTRAPLPPAATRAKGAANAPRRHHWVWQKRPPPQ